MTFSHFIRSAALLCAGVSLAACGSQLAPETQIFKSLGDQIKNRKVPTAQVTASQIAQTLQATPSPVALFEFEKRNKAQGMLIQIETNGPYRTFGNQARNVIVLRDGMITSTRGLGGDLMSSGENALLSLVRSNAAGNATYVQRFLTPEGVTEQLSYDCTVTPGGGQNITLGAVDASAATVSAACRSDTLSFTNSYAVSADGTISSSRQWLGSYIGYVGTQYLRR